MKKLLTMVIGFCVLACAGCAKTYMIDVPEQYQKAERYLYQQEIAVEELGNKQAQAYDAVIVLWESKKIDDATMAKAYKIKYDLDKIYMPAAHEALKEYRTELDKGIIPPDKTLKRAINTIKKYLDILKGFK